LEFHPSRGYLSTVEPFLHFGLGAARSVDSAVVRWPDGARQVLLQVAANQVLRVDHRDAKPWPERRGGEPENTDARLFHRVATNNGLAFRHEKAIYLQASPGRFERRVLPGGTDWQDMGALIFDADGDGDNDLLVV